MKLKCVAGILLGLSTIAMAGEPIVLNWGNIDTTSSDQQAASKALVRSARIRAAATVKGESAEEAAAYIVQFTGIIQPEWRSWLEGTGAEIKGYVPENAFTVWATADEIAVIGENENVEWVGAVKAEYKRARPVRAALAKRAAAKTAETAARYRVTGYDVNGGAALVARLASELGVTAEDYFSTADRCVVTVALTESQLETVTGWDEVEWVEHRLKPVLFNDAACKTNMMAVTNVWKGISSGGLGLTGAGQIVAVADTGLDKGSTSDIHADFSGRIVAGYGWSSGAYSSSYSWGDEDSHGTHVCGSVLGDGSKSSGRFRGMAYGARLVIQGQQADLGGLPSNLSKLFVQAYTAGARIHSDSWGYSDSSYWGSYVSDCQQIDQYVWSNQNFLVVVAAGNDGIDANSDGVVDPGEVSPPSTAKNCLCVGAAESYRSGLESYTWGSSWPDDFPADPISSDPITATLTPQGMAAFSSRGPTDDGRFKPDIVAPGTDIVSTRSRATTNTGWGVYTSNTNYLYMGGTSMATPLTSGAMALLRQWLVESNGIAEPTAALMKAVLINGARDMTPGQYGTATKQEITARPDRSQGFGHVNLYNALCPATGHFLTMVTNRLATSASYTTNISVGQTGAGKYVFTLAYSDYWPTSLSGKMLVNDLDLTVTKPSGTVIYPNNLTKADHTNNVEFIEFEADEMGDYTVKVFGYNVPSGSSQPFALVMRGPTTEALDPVAPVFLASTESGTVARHGEYEYDFSELLTMAPYPSPTWTISTSVHADEYVFEDGYLYCMPTNVGSYVFTVTASNASGTAQCVLTLTVTPGAPDTPNNPWCSVLGTTDFTVEWTAVDYATSYRLDVIQGTTFEVGGGEGLSEGFAGGITAPTGWTFSGLGGTYTSSGNYGAASPSLKFDTLNDGIQTPALVSPTNVSYWAKGMAAGSVLTLEAAANDAWSTVAADSISTTATTFSHALNSAVTNLRWTMTTKPSGANVAFDDVQIQAATAAPGTWLAGYSNLTVNTTSQKVSGVSSGTDYAFRIRAVNTAGISANSPEVSITTSEAASVPGWIAFPAQSVNVGDILQFQPEPYVSGSPAPAISLSSSTAAGADYTFDSDGLIFNPSAQGTFTFTFNATNSEGSASQTLTVTATATAPSFTSGTSYSATVGEPMSFTATATGIPTPVVALTSSTASAGEYSSNAGTVSFTPSAVGVYTFTFSATNVAGSASQTVTVTVTPAPVTVPTLTLSSATAGGFTAGWTACDGVSTYTLQVATDNAFSSGGSGASVTLLNNVATNPATVPEGWTYNLSSSTAKYLQMLTIANYVQSPAFSTANLTALTLTLKVRTFGGTSGTSSNLLVQYSTDGGTTWTELGTVSATSSTLTEKTLDAAACLGNASVCLKWSVPGATSSKGMGMSSIVLTGTESAGGGSLMLNETVSATSYAVTGLSASTLYYARVKGTGDWSSVQSITTLASGGGETNPVVESDYEQWLAGQGLNVTDYPQTGEADNGKMQNWEAYVADLNPSDSNAVLALDVVETAVASTDEVALTFPASSSRYYQMVYKTNLLGASLTNNLGWGTANMVVTNALPSGEWFGEIRVLLDAPTP